MAAENIMQSQETEDKERLFTVEEMCKLLKVDKRTMCDWIQYRKIPYVRVDKKYIRFRMSDIAKWVEKKRHSRRRTVG